MYAMIGEKVCRRLERIEQEKNGRPWCPKTMRNEEQKANAQL